MSIVVVTGLPIYSLYGSEGLPKPSEPDYAVDSILGRVARQPGEGGLRGLEGLIFDIQDVGTRVYTYIWTMSLSMQAAAQSGLFFVVLDRPNPINGIDMEGSVLDARFRSFVGLYPIPLRHGMTIGELALLFNRQYAINAELTVVGMEGWEREAWFDETGLIWVPPSPNIPTLTSALVYSGMVIFEGTNVSEGRGTTRPFELIGAPWLDAGALLREMKKLNLPGVLFRPARFVPTFSKYRGEVCKGVQVHVTDRESYRPFLTSLHLLAEIIGLHRKELKWTKGPRGAVHYFDAVVGTDEVRRALVEGVEVGEIYKETAEELHEFSRTRDRYLLY